MDRNYGVIVVGAGPAGATLSYELARKGIRVLLLEKETLPRYKCCAGGISVKTARLLTTDIHGLAEDIVTGVTVKYKGSNPYRGHHDQPLIYTVMRDRFDNALVEQAKEAGAVIAQGQKVGRIETGAGGVEVLTPAGTFRSQYVVGADGAHSAVAREAGLRSNTACIVAIETEVQVSSEEMARWKSQGTIDLGIPGGYAWVFPKLDHLSIGSACLGSRANGLKQRYREFFESLNIAHYTVTRWSGGLIPMCGGTTIVSRGRVALLGDAAGLVDPLTGEGIHNAIFSARLAAPVIEQSLLSGVATLQNYQQAVDEKIMPEIRIARVLSKLFVRFPGMAFGMLNRDERVWRACCYLLRGEIDYSTIKQRIGGFKGIYALLSLK